MPAGIFRRQVPSFAALMKPHKQPLQVRLEKDQLPISEALNHIRVPAGGAVRIEPVGIKQNERAGVPAAALIVSPSTSNGEFDDPSGITAARNGDIEMQTQLLVFAQMLQPPCE